jgi:hypothetical protein
MEEDSSSLSAEEGYEEDNVSSSSHHKEVDEDVQSSTKKIKRVLRKAFKTSTADLLEANRSKRKVRTPNQHRRNRSTSDRLHVPLKRSECVMWLQDCNKLHFALESQWNKMRRITFDVFEDRYVHSFLAFSQSSPSLSMSV